MMELRGYQQRSLDQLQGYLRLAANEGAKRAFLELTERPYLSVPQLPELPYVCLRIPTGGGKTLMACHALTIFQKEYLQRANGLCLWLVPSNAILEQTLAALRNRQHPYRQAVDAACGGLVSVMDLKEALYVQRSVLDGETCIIVSTLAAFRVEDTDGRKVYESAGALQHHFSGLSAELQEVLERNENEVIPFSLSNVLRMRRPLVIMDEAHNARTPLSFDTLSRFRPACVIEFTATPELEQNPDKGRFASNVLCHVSAAELKAEEMIKLPIHLETRTDWTEVVQEAVSRRHQLEKISKQEELETGEYIRPIMLLQAQSKSKTKETITVDALKQHLMENHKIPEEQIAIATGGTKEIEDVDLFSRECPIRYIITVQALKEGWDCSFAYVLCSVAEIGSQKSVEQVLGRILRLPKAEKKHHAELNFAYAFAASQRFMDAADSLRDALIENGFERLEAGAFIKPFTQQKMLGGTLFGLEVSEKVTEVPDLSILPKEVQERVQFDEKTKEIIAIAELNDSDVLVLQKCFQESVDKKAVERLQQKSKGVFVADKQKERHELGIPRLYLKEQGQLELFDDEHLLGEDWNLSECDAELSEAEFPSEFTAGRTGELDITEKGTIEVVDHYRALTRQLRLLGMEPGWDLPNLVNWLDRQIPHPDVTRVQSTLFLRKGLEGLMNSRGVNVEQLAQQKYRLRYAFEEKIKVLRIEQRKKGFQRILFERDPSEIVVSRENCLVFNEDLYGANSHYGGGYRFKKHLFQRIGELKSEGAEFDCAVMIDQCSEVKFWLRNLPKRPDASFWLQTASHKFYPDFVVWLNDGRVLVVEYKGEHLVSADEAKEKKAIGELWAARSGGTCLFWMPSGKKELEQIDSVIRG